MRQHIGICQRLMQVKMTCLPLVVYESLRQLGLKANIIQVVVRRSVKQA